MPDGPRGWNPHDLMSEAVFAETPGDRGTEFGTHVHEFAAAYASDADPEPGGDEPDWAHVRELVDGLDDDLAVEQEAVLPLSVDGETVAISGVVDLVERRPDRVRIIDLKTDRGRHAEAEYRKQLSVYHHVLDAWFPDRPVESRIFYTHEGESVPVEPLSTDELRALLRERRAEADGGADG